MTRNRAIERHSRRPRNSGQRESDLQLVAEMYLRGNTQATIAEHLNKNRPYSLTVATISNDIKELHKRWRAAQMESFDAAKATELEKINHLEVEYWAAWDASKTPVTETNVERTEDKSTSKNNVTVPTYSRTKTKRNELTSHGDIRFLQGVQWCIEQRVKILGLYAATKMKIDWRKQAEEEGLDPSQVFNDMVAVWLDAASLDGTVDGGGAGRSEEAIEG
jgi:hypothetical protein